MENPCEGKIYLCGDQAYESIGLITKPAVVFRNIVTGEQDVRIIGSEHFSGMVETTAHELVQALRKHLRAAE